LHLAGEFIESNLGSSLEQDGSVTVRAIGQQYSFTPQCVLVPTDTPVTIRATSSDVVHGFLIGGTNFNTMLVPGYITTIPVRFAAPGEHHLPCHEFCGTGHEGMWGNIVAIDRREFLRRAATQRRLDCVK
jgi:cytochrome c oxidase subunit II